MKTLQNSLIQLLVGGFLLVVILALIFKVSRLREDYKVMSNNYDASTIELQKFKSDSDKDVARIRQEVLTKQQLLDSRNSEIKYLLTTAKDLNIKVKKLKYLLSIKIDTVYQTETVTHTDTIPGTTIYRHIDTLTIGKLHIKRIQIIGNDIAKYEVKYNPILNILVHREKVGKWKLRNLFVRRDTETLVDVVSDDKLLNVESVRAIELR